MKKLPAKFELPLFALLLSGLMSFIVSGVALMRNLGAMPEWAAWIHAWLSSWLVAFPSVILCAAGEKSRRALGRAKTLKSNPQNLTRGLMVALNG